MKITRQIILFFIYYFLQFFAQAFSYTLLVTFLTSLGYSATQRSVFFVMDALAGMGLQVILGYLCDKHQKIKPYLYGCIVVYMLGTYFLYKTTQINFLIHLILVPAVGCMLRLVTSLSDSLTIETSEEVKNNYGVIRLFGSIGWAVGSPITAWIVEKFGYGSLGIAFIIAIGLSWISIIGISDVNKVHSAEPISFKDVKRLLKNRKYVIMVAILFLLYIVDMTQSYSVVDKVWYLSGTEKDVGNYWMIAAMMELPRFFFGGKLIKKMGAMKLLIFSGFFYGVRYVVFGRATGIMHIFIGALLQGLTFPLMWVASKILIDEESPDNMKTSGQRVANSIYSCGSSLVAPVMVGLLEDGVGVNFSLYVIAAISFAATLRAAMMLPKSKKSSQ